MVTTVRPTASMDLNTAFDRAQQQFKGCLLYTSDAADE